MHENRDERWEQWGDQGESWCPGPQWKARAPTLGLVGPESSQRWGLWERVGPSIEGRGLGVQPQGCEWPGRSGNLRVWVRSAHPVPSIPEGALSQDAGAGAPPVHRWLVTPLAPQTGLVCSPVLRVEREPPGPGSALKSSPTAAGPLSPSKLPQGAWQNLLAPESQGSPSFLRLLGITQVLVPSSLPAQKPKWPQRHWPGLGSVRNS